MSGRFSSIFRGLVALLCALFVSCAYPAPRGPSPLYALDTPWFNDPIGGMRPWKADDRIAATRAAQAREARWLGLTAGRAERPRAASPAARKQGPRSEEERVEPTRRAKKGDKKRRSEKRRRQKRRRKKRRQARAALARIEPAALRPAQVEPVEVRLGDGSVADELVVAAQRLVGIRDALVGPAFVEHLLVVSAVELPRARRGERTVGQIWEGLARRGRILEDPTAAKPGHLAFFHGTHDLDRDGKADEDLTMAAVVESVRPGGVMVCIGEVHGEVRRFVVDPTRPWVRRDEQVGEVVNSPLRWRSLKDAAGVPVLAGSLLRGVARM